MFDPGAAASRMESERIEMDKAKLIGTGDNKQEFRTDGIVGKRRRVAKFTPRSRARLRAHMPKKDRNR